MFPAFAAAFFNFCNHPVLGKLAVCLDKFFCKLAGVTKLCDLTGFPTGKLGETKVNFFDNDGITCCI